MLRLRKGKKNTRYQDDNFHDIAETSRDDIFFNVIRGYSGKIRELPNKTRTNDLPITSSAVLPLGSKRLVGTTSSN